jgi:hypothetical protein
VPLRAAIAPAALLHHRAIVSVVAVVDRHACFRNGCGRAAARKKTDFAPNMTDLQHRGVGVFRQRKIEYDMIILSGGEKLLTLIPPL